MADPDFGTTRELIDTCRDASQRRCTRTRELLRETDILVSASEERLVLSRATLARVGTMIEVMTVR